MTTSADVSAKIFAITIRWYGRALPNAGQVKNLSKDRWEIFRIQNEDLLDVTKILVK